MNKRRIFLTSVTVLSVVLAVIVYLRTKPVDVDGEPLPNSPADNAFVDIMQLARGTVAQSEESSVMRERVKLLPRRGDVELRRRFRDETAALNDALSGLSGRPFVPSERWNYSGETFPHEAVGYWTAIYEAEIDALLIDKNYGAAAKVLGSATALLQQLKKHGDFAVCMVMNGRIRAIFQSVAHRFKHIPDDACHLFLEVLVELDDAFPPTGLAVDAEEWGRIETYRELQRSPGSKYAYAYLDLRATARRVKVYFRRLREEVEKPVLLRKQPEPVGGMLDFADDPVFKIGIDPGHNDVTRCTLRVLAAAFAVRAQRAKTGRLPESLAEVYTKNDPYTGGSLIYKVVDGGFQVFSPGFDGDNDGGIPASIRDDDGDITIRIADPDKVAERPVILR